MTDDLKQRGPADRTRVNVNEQWEVDWWCKQLDCTQAELRSCVSSVGVMADRVRTCIAAKKKR